MELNPVQVAFNNQIEADPSFCDLSDKVLSLNDKVERLTAGQKEIKSTLDKEMKSQADFEARVQQEFDKGSRKFEKLEAEMEQMKEDYKKGVKDIIDTINNKELSSLKEEIRNTKEEKKLKREFWLGVAKTVLSAVVVALVIYGLSKIGILPEK